MLLKIYRFYIPAFIKKKVMRELAGYTAAAFGCEAPKYTGLSYKACLEEYALFTSRQVQRLLEGDGDIEKVKNSLYAAACRMGGEFRQRFHITKPEEVMMANRMMYKILKIELQEDSPGDIRISKCFFSRYYSGEVCRIISALDAGAAAGLSGGGKLEFYERMTEGNTCCRAHFNMGEM